MSSSTCHRSRQVSSVASVQVSSVASVQGDASSPRRQSSQQSDTAGGIAAHANSKPSFNYGLALLCCKSLQQLQTPTGACQAVWHVTEQAGGC